MLLDTVPSFISRVVGTDSSRMDYRQSHENSSNIQFCTVALANFPYLLAICIVSSQPKNYQQYCGLLTFFASPPPRLGKWDPPHFEPAR